MDKVELMVFGKDAVKLEEMANPQLTTVITKSVEGRTVCTAVIGDRPGGEGYAIICERIDHRG